MCVCVCVCVCIQAAISLKVDGLRSPRAHSLLFCANDNGQGSLAFTEDCISYAAEHKVNDQFEIMLSSTVSL